MPTRTKKLPPIHPGRVLKAVLEDAGSAANARASGTPANWLTKIISGQKSISRDTALRLARYFGTSAQMWMNLQARYDLESAADALAD
jgi:addiction module HigA family antidote